MCQLPQDRHGQVVREVALACFALPLPGQAGQFLPLRVALVRDLRRHVPSQEQEEETERDLHQPPWWQEDWKAEPTPALPTTAKLVPIVTTADTINAVELAQTYTRRWPVQENVIKDWLLPLGLEIVRSQMTKTGVFAARRSRDHVVGQLSIELPLVRTVFELLEDQKMPI